MNFDFDANPDPPFDFDAIPDPTFNCDADPCGIGSGSATLVICLLNCNIEKFNTKFNISKKVRVAHEMRMLYLGNEYQLPSPRWLL